MADGQEHRLGGGESGQALVFALVAIVTLGVIAVAMTITGQGALERSHKRVQRVLDLPPTQSAITKYQYALQTEVANDNNDYTIPYNTLVQQLDDPSTDEVMSDTDSRIPTRYQINAGDPRTGIFNMAGSSPHRVSALPANARYTTREKLHLGQGGAACTAIGLPASDCTGNQAISGFWQLLRVDLPDLDASDALYSDGDLVAYFRVWVGSRDGSWATDSRVERVQFRPGRFTDYQLMTDGPIHFEQGASINGPVHSNGYDVDIYGSTPPAPGVKIWSNAPINCTGALSGFDTANGGIQVHGTNCATNVDPNNNRTINFLRVEQSFQAMHADAVAGTANVREYTNVGDGRFGTYRVDLQGNNIVVHNPRNAYGCWVFAWSCFTNGASGSTISLVGRPHMALLFDDDVIVSGGNVKSRVTIAAHRENSDAGAANIYLEGDVGPGNNSSSLGLLAQGNVIVQQSWNFNSNISSTPGDCDVTNIHAAVVAATGTLTIPPETVTQNEQPNAPFCNQTFTLEGTLAAHRSPVMYWEWDNGHHAGYANRHYKYDPDIRYHVPPYFPLTDTWQVSNAREGNEDCIYGSDYLDPNCT